MKKLNLENIDRQLNQLGLDRADLVKELDVSREAISKWFKGTYLPKPSKLLKLGKLLKLKYNQLIIDENKLEPVVAFRKVGQKKTKPIDIQRGLEMGYALEKLIPYLPFEIITRTPILKSPTNDYDYIQQVADFVRKKIGADNIKIELSKILSYFNDLRIIMIPLLLGEKHNHENAMHVYLPQSSTTWVYINLDTQIFDFKFWLIHELGHVIAPNLEVEESEVFADNFAGALLFPNNISKKTYSELRVLGTAKSRILRVIELAKEYVISPYTIQKELDKYAEKNKQIKIDLGADFPKYCSRFLKSYKVYSKYILGEDISISKYMTFVETEFNTIFFKMLRKYSSENELTYSFLRTIINLPAGDTKEFLKYLNNGSD